MPTAEKAVWETVHKCLWKKERKKKKKKREKKEQTTNACGKERKTKPQMLVANEKWQANSWYQMKNKQKTQQQKHTWNHLKNPNGGLPANIRWKNHQQITTV